MVTEQSRDSEVPANYEEMVSGDDSATCKKTMKVEIESISKFITWELVRLLTGRKFVKTRWVYEAKRNIDSMDVRHKARLVASDFSQIEGMDFQKVCFPVSRNATVRLTVSVSVAQIHKQRLLGVRNAFVNAWIMELINM